MRMISLLLALLAIGWLLTQQLGGGGKTEAPVTEPGSDGVDAPKVPTTTEELKGFENQMNDYMQALSEQRKQQMQDSLNQ